MSCGKGAEHSVGNAVRGDITVAFDAEGGRCPPPIENLGRLHSMSKLRVHVKDGIVPQDIRTTRSCANIRTGRGLNATHGGGDVSQSDANWQRA